MATKRKPRRARTHLRALPWVLWGSAGVALVVALATAGARAIMRASGKSLDTLTPLAKSKFSVLVERMARRGIRLVVGSTRRTLDEQKDLLDQGKTATSKGAHPEGNAIDVYVVDPTTGQADTAGHRGDLYRILHQEWAALGGYGLAYWPYPNGPIRYITTKSGKVWDAGHLQVTPVPAPPTAAPTTATS